MLIVTKIVAYSINNIVLQVYKSKYMYADVHRHTEGF